MKRHRVIGWSIGLMLLGAAGCGGEGETCTLSGGGSCPDGQVCEEVQGGAPACFAPLWIEGRVFDLGTEAAIPGARVVAVDANGAARSTVVESGMDGAYSLPIRAPRDRDGRPIPVQVTLRADAPGYQTFPTAPRTGIPIDLSSGMAVDGRGIVVRNAATDIGLVAREDLSGRANVSGRIDHPQGGGMLVVAEQSGRAVASAISDENGRFVLFDVPTSTTTIGAYKQGLRVTPIEISVVQPETRDVVLTARTDGLATVSGTVQIVDAPGGSATSVILVLESTFMERVGRGESPPGLRAANVTGAWSIEGVAPGRYVALAGFENDGLVRDPDTSIGGTSIVRFEVTEGRATVDLGAGFKVTGALEVVSPGATMVETIRTSPPTFVWRDDASEDGYEVRVYDAFGNMVHENTTVPRVTGSSTVSYTWTGATLRTGMVYQFRAWSWRNDARRGRVFISATEDLRGAFIYRP